MPRVFGELELTTRSLVWLSVAGLVASLTALGDDNLALGQILLISLASVAVQTAALSSALVFLPKQLERMPILLAPLLMLSGALRGFVLSWLSTGELDKAFGQAANASVSNLVWGAVALTLIAQREKFNLAFRQQTAQLLINPNSFSVGMQPEIAHLTTRVREIVESLNSPRTATRAPIEALSFEIRTILEPLQLRLSVSKDLRPKIGVNRLILSAIKNPNPSPIFVLVTWTALNLGGAFTLFGAYRVVPSLIIAGATLLGLLWLANRTSQRPLKFILTTMAVLLPTLATDSVMTAFGLATGLSEPAVFPFSPLASYALMTLSSCINIVEADRESLLAKLRTLTSPSSDFEDYLHSSVQGVLLSIIHGFLGLRNPTDEDFRALAAELNEFLARDFDEEFSRAQLEPKERLQVLKANWSPILKVEISENLLLSASPLLQQHILIVLEEGIRNASRHSGATLVSVQSQLISKDRLQLTILSDRHVTQTPGQKGGGQRMLDKLCLSWRLDYSPSATKLTANLLVF